MTFNNAKLLHNEDEVTIKETGEIVTVLQAYQSDNGKYIVLECDDGNTYYNDEVKWNDDFLKRERTISMDYSKLKYIRLFKDEYSEEKWKIICEVLDITDNDKLISIELGVAKVTPQIH